MPPLVFFNFTKVLPETQAFIIIFKIFLTWNLPSFPPRYGRKGVFTTSFRKLCSFLIEYKKLRCSNKKPQ